VQIIRTNISGAEEKLTDAHGLLVKFVLAGNIGLPILQRALLAVLVEDFCVSHKARSVNGFSAKPISVKSAVS